MSEVRIRLRPLQQKALEALDARRFGVLVCHRRFGKTVLAVSRLCRNATRAGESYRGAYIAPTYRQAKDVAWDYLKKIALAAGAKVNEGELRVDFKNGARIRLYGAENPDSLRGLNLCDVVFDEVAQMPYSMWSEIVLPMILATHGRALFLGTPKGRNALWKVWENARLHDEEWAALMYRASETGILSEEDLAVARRETDESEYEQEYECSFTAAVAGAYYGRLMEQLGREGKIAAVPYQPGFPVVTAWDLGFSDSTAIWFAQVVGREVHVIDYYQASGAGLDHYVKVLREKGYVDMRTDEDDRRRVNVTVTDEGLKCLAEKHEFLADYFDMYIGEIGEENAGRMTELLKLTADCAPSLMERIMRERKA